ncbi:MAG: hypothetical protein NTZ53_11510 [Cyanobacteria bacterium]|nr:hypothetical protein [Cyanobacteriota bacterium]
MSEVSHRHGALKFPETNLEPKRSLRRLDPDKQARKKGPSQASAKSLMMTTTSSQPSDALVGLGSGLH